MTANGWSARGLGAAAGLVVAAIAAVPSEARPAQGATVWVAGATEKIRPSAPARTETTARIAAARNEFEAFQIVVTGTARGVTATASDLTGPGPAIGGVKLYREAVISLTRPSAPDGATGKWPDALVPDVDDVVGEQRNAFPFDVRSESRAIWVEVFVPSTATAGDYTGSVTVRFSGGKAATIPVQLTVWNFTLPTASSLRTAFSLDWGGLPSGHKFSSSDLVRFATLRARYGQLALDHRVSLSNHDDGDWNDLDHFDQYYGPLMSGTAPTRLAGARLTSVEYLGPEDVANMQRWVAHYQAKKDGWFERLFQYTCDEPPNSSNTWDDCRRRANVAKAADPAFRTLITATIQDVDQNGLTGLLDLDVPIVNYMDDKPGYPYPGVQRASYDPFLDPKQWNADGLNEVWMYQSCMSHGCGGVTSDTYFTGWPSYMIDASAVRNRAMQWLEFEFRVSGELYWDTVYAYNGTDAWTDQWDFGGNGDGTLFYPGTPAKIGGQTDIPVASIRLKMIREGMEDYEYLLLAAQKAPDAVAAIVSGLFPAAYQTEQDPAQVMAARKQLASIILGVTLP
jgi:Glycoside hydrolase 123, catalytic domain/Glycoside hydrolase 123 N-terminal domain